MKLFLSGKSYLFSTVIWAFLVIIEENDVAYNAEVICKDGKLIGITEMVVDILLSGIGE